MFPLVKRSDGWWIKGLFPSHGPYKNKSEAQDVKRGIRNFYRANPSYLHNLKRRKRMAKKKAAAKSKKIEIARQDIVDLFVEFGSKQAPKWSPSRLTAKIEKFAEQVGEDTEAETEETQATLDAIRAAYANEQEIVVVADAEDEEDQTKPAKKGKATKGKGKKAAKEEEPEEDEEEEEDDEDSEEEEPEEEEDEEEEESVPVKAKKGAKGKKGGKAAGKKASSKKSEGGPSNKQRVYGMWEKSKDKSVKKAESYYEKIDEAVKLSTIKGWISAWNRGENLPAGANA